MVKKVTFVGFSWGDRPSPLDPPLCAATPEHRWGKGDSKKVEGNGNLRKTKKTLPIMLAILFNNNADLKNN